MSHGAIVDGKRLTFLKRSYQADQDVRVYLAGRRRQACDRWSPADEAITGGNGANLSPQQFVEVVAAVRAGQDGRKCGGRHIGLLCAVVDHVAWR
ncbi:hypothetical protein D9M69_615370 [compost metagenome]